MSFHPRLRLGTSLVAASALIATTLSSAIAGGGTAEPVYSPPYTSSEDPVGGTPSYGTGSYSGTPDGVYGDSGTSGKKRGFMALLPFIPSILQGIAGIFKGGDGVQGQSAYTPGMGMVAPVGGTYALPSQQMAQGAAGVAYKIQAIAADGQVSVVDPSSYEFSTGDHFVVWAVANMPGMIAIRNITPLGVQRELGSIPVQAGQPVRLPAQGSFDFRDTKGDEQLVLTLISCQGNAVRSGLRDIGQSMEAPPASYTYPTAIGSCETASNAYSTRRVRDIGQSSFDSGASYATAPFTATEMQSGQIDPRSVSILFHHR